MLGVMTVDDQTSPRPLILLDCDPGHDDAIALVAAARHTELVGITTVAGNAPLDRTTYNALVMRDLLGIDVAVHSGADRPLVAEPKFAAFVHGESGLDGADLPRRRGRPTAPMRSASSSTPAAPTEGIWLVPTGPLTNIALALRAAPDLIGAHRRHLADGRRHVRQPDAGRRVQHLGRPGSCGDRVRLRRPAIMMAGLDLTHQFQATPERIDRVRALPGRLAAVLADLFVFFAGDLLRRHDHGTIDGAAVHDPFAVLALTHPELFERVDRPCRRRDAPASSPAG